MKIATLKTGLGSLALLPGLALAAPAVADKADNAFMMICTALVLFMTIPGIALFYGGLIRGKNVLSMLTQVIVTFGLVCVLWVVYGYTLAFGAGGSFFGNFDWVLLKNIELKAMLTPNNRQWSGRHLLQEIASEHVYMKWFGKSAHK